MKTTYMRWLIAGVCALSGALWPAAQGLGAPIWFDETNGGTGYGSFQALAKAYQSFMGAPESTITFDNLSEGVKLSDQYLKSHGVLFTQTSGGPNNSYSGARTEGGAIVEDLTGYDGTYHPNGNRVYLKFNNEYAATPFIFMFNDPVSSVGAFLAMGMEGKVHTLDVSLFDKSGGLIGQRTVQSWLWESATYRQNYETFFAAGAGGSLISRVEIRNLATTNYANALAIDDVSWSVGIAPGAVPEPATVLMLVAGGLGMRLTRGRILRRA